MVTSTASSTPVSPVVSDEERGDVRDKKKWLENVFKKSPGGSTQPDSNPPTPCSPGSLVEDRHKWIQETLLSKSSETELAKPAEKAGADFADELALPSFDDEEPNILPDIDSGGIIPDNFTMPLNFPTKDQEDKSIVKTEGIQSRTAFVDKIGETVATAPVAAEGLLLDESGLVCAGEGNKTRDPHPTSHSNGMEAENRLSDSGSLELPTEQVNGSSPTLPTNPADKFAGLSTPLESTHHQCLSQTQSREGETSENVENGSRDQTSERNVSVLFRQGQQETSVDGATDEAPLQEDNTPKTTSIEDSAPLPVEGTLHETGEDSPSPTWPEDQEATLGKAAITSESDMVTDAPQKLKESIPEASRTDDRSSSPSPNTQTVCEGAVDDALHETGSEKPEAEVVNSLDDSAPLSGDDDFKEAIIVSDGDDVEMQAIHLPAEAMDDSPPPETESDTLQPETLNLVDEHNGFEKEDDSVSSSGNDEKTNAIVISDADGVELESIHRTAPLESTTAKVDAINTRSAADVEIEEAERVTSNPLQDMPVKVSEDDAIGVESNVLDSDTPTEGAGKLEVEDSGKPFCFAESTPVDAAIMSSVLEPECLDDRGSLDDPLLETASKTQVSVEHAGCKTGGTSESLSGNDETTRAIVVTDGDVAKTQAIGVALDESPPSDPLQPETPNLAVEHDFFGKEVTNDSVIGDDETTKAIVVSVADTVELSATYGTAPGENTEELVEAINRPPTADMEIGEDVKSISKQLPGLPVKATEDVPSVNGSNMMGSEISTVVSTEFEDASGKSPDSMERTLLNATVMSNVPEPEISEVEDIAHNSDQGTFPGDSATGDLANARGTETAATAAVDTVELELVDGEGIVSTTSDLAENRLEAESRDITPSPASRGGFFESGKAMINSTFDSNESGTGEAPQNKEKEPNDTTGAFDETAIERVNTMATDESVEVEACGFSLPSVESGMEPEIGTPESARELDVADCKTSVISPIVSSRAAEVAGEIDLVPCGFADVPFSNGETHPKATIEEKFRGAGKDVVVAKQESQSILKTAASKATPHEQKRVNAQGTGHTLQNPGRVLDVANPSQGPKAETKIAPTEAEAEEAILRIAGECTGPEPFGESPLNEAQEGLPSSDPRAETDTAETVEDDVQVAGNEFDSTKLTPVRGASNAARLDILKDEGDVPECARTNDSNNLLPEDASTAQTNFEKSGHVDRDDVVSADHYSVERAVDLAVVGDLDCHAATVAIPESIFARTIESRDMMSAQAEISSPNCTGSPEFFTSAVDNNVDRTCSSNGEYLLNEPKEPHALLTELDERVIERVNTTATDESVEVAASVSSPEAPDITTEPKTAVAENARGNGAPDRQLLVFPNSVPTEAFRDPELELVCIDDAPARLDGSEPTLAPESDTEAATNETTNAELEPQNVTEMEISNEGESQKKFETDSSNVESNKHIDETDHEGQENVNVEDVALPIPHQQTKLSEGKAITDDRISWEAEAPQSEDAYNRKTPDMSIEQSLTTSQGNFETPQKATDTDEVPFVGDFETPHRHVGDSEKDNVAAESALVADPDEVPFVGDFETPHRDVCTKSLNPALEDEESKLDVSSTKSDEEVLAQVTTEDTITASNQTMSESLIDQPRMTNGSSKVKHIITAFSSDSSSNGLVLTPDVTIPVSPSSSVRSLKDDMGVNQHRIDPNKLDFLHTRKGKAFVEHAKRNAEKFREAKKHAMPESQCGTRNAPLKNSSSGLVESLLDNGAPPSVPGKSNPGIDCTESSASQLEVFPRQSVLKDEDIGTTVSCLETCAVM